jgi:medium-chain acyl-[acyl-carrier-protein] hydrolase
MKIETWKEQFTVRSYEADVTGRASILTLCNYLQEAASNHAYALRLSVEQLAELRLIWMLARLRVSVTRYPSWRDVVTVETWPSGENGLFATREFMMYDAEGNELARATSAWPLVDVERRRPVRLPEYIRELRVPHREYPLPGEPPRLKAPSGDIISRDFTVRRSDLDLNRHTNNVRYVEWALETLPQETVDGLTVSELDVVFRAETTFGDEVLSLAGVQNDDGRLIVEHAIIRKRDQKEAALVQSTWTPVRL